MGGVLHAEAVELEPGALLEGKYRVERFLAGGGMGAVYVATHTGLRKRVAIKVMKADLAHGPLVERFHREAIAASQIGHEGIVEVTDLGTTERGEPFLVMEYLDGRSLADMLRQSGPLAIETACELTCEILAPLAAAHAAGIVHRDLKPDNVFLSRQSRGELVKLLDFGISRMAGIDHDVRLTKTGLVLGTPHYMSPEQARGDSEISFASDIYSVGVILYEMLTGRVPCTGENYNQLLYRVMSGDFPAPRSLRQDMPEALEHVVCRALAAGPNARFAGAAEFSRALLPFCRSAYRDAELSAHSGERLGYAATAAPATGEVGESALSWQRRLASGSSQQMAPSGEIRPGVVTPTLAPTVRTGPARRGLYAAVALAVLAAGAAVAIPAFNRDGGSQQAEPPSSASPVAQPVTEASEPPPQPVPSLPDKVDIVTLRFAVTPEDAEIRVDGQIVAGPSLDLPRDDVAHSLEVSAPGYQTFRDDQLRLSENQRIVIPLAAEPDPVVQPTARDRRPRVRRPAAKRERIESASPYQ